MGEGIWRWCAQALTVSTSPGSRTLPHPCPPASPLTFQVHFEYISLSLRNRENLYFFFTNIQSDQTDFPLQFMSTFSWLLNLRPNTLHPSSPTTLPLHLSSLALTTPSGSLSLCLPGHGDSPWPSGLPQPS